MLQLYALKKDMIKYITIKIIINKCSGRSMEVYRPALLGNYDRKANRPTNQPNGQTGS